MTGLRDRLAAALCICTDRPADSHSYGCPGAVLDGVWAVVQSELDAEIAGLRADSQRVNKSQVAEINASLRKADDLTDTVIAERDQLRAAVAEVKRLCQFTISASTRAPARWQAEDTLAAIARIEARSQPGSQK